MFYLIVLIFFSAFANADNIIKYQPNNIKKEIQKLEENHQKINTYTKYYQKRYDTPISSESSDYEDSIVEEEKNNNEEALTQRIQKTYKKILTSKKPKLVIIIDDIANKKQLDDVSVIGLKITPSIFPISPNDKTMLNAISKLDFFMVHLPLEAHKYKDELDTIQVNDSQERIKTKIKSIKQTMPKTKYINNHTGSKFTENKESTRLLLRILDSYLIDFVDSRTTPNSVISEIAKEQNKFILYRDVFMDNTLDAPSLYAQIKEAIKIAKTRGYAILIAHPHKQSLQIIKNVKNGLLKEVDVIYLDELDSMLKAKKEFHK